MPEIKEDGVYTGSDGIPFQFLKGHRISEEQAKDLKKTGPFVASTGVAPEAKVTGPAEAKVNPNPAPPAETAAQKKAREQAEAEATGEAD